MRHTIAIAVAAALLALTGCNSNTRIEVNNNTTQIEKQRTQNAVRASGSGGSMGVLGAVSLDGVRDQINGHINAWHRAAATGDSDAYFGAMTDNAVFLGTDRSERWTRPEFIDTYGDYFDGPTEYGDGAWTFEPRRRFVTVHESGRVAWFDEVLWSESYGHCRGTGVVILDDDNDWKITHFSLSFLIDNDIAAEVTSQSKAFDAANP